MNRRLFRKVRLAILLVIFVLVAHSAYATKILTTHWNKSLWVVIYPINGDGQPATQEYISSLTKDDFQPIAEFMQRQARHHGLTLEDPVTVRLGHQVTTPPPDPPWEGAPWKIALWSIKLRYYAWEVDHYDGPRPDIKIFVKYYRKDGQREFLDNSVGVEKAMVGIVTAWATPEQADRNNFVIAHEMLHTVGATDKYDTANNLPIFPHGYADPLQQPRYPQRFTEIMGGRTPLSKELAKMPSSLKAVVIGPQTAREIHWLEAE